MAMENPTFMGFSHASTLHANFQFTAGIYHHPSSAMMKHCKEVSHAKPKTVKKRRPTR
jgi:hypothetical protein